jgi:hypothetical protein
LGLVVDYWTEQKCVFFPELRLLVTPPRFLAGYTHHFHIASAAGYQVSLTDPGLQLAKPFFFCCQGCFSNYG